jgi:aminoglycoside 3-N-acetyltransferase
MIVRRDLAEVFWLIGVRRGDVLMLHSDALALAQLPPMQPNERFNVLFEALDEVLGPEGTLILPTFTYSLTSNKTFSVEDTPSEVGIITEHFRHLPGVLRSGSPIFSLAASGPLAKAFVDAPIDDCFGPRSAFGLLDRCNAWLVCLGCAFDRITFVHYVEQRASVPYRFFKWFEGNVVSGGNRTSVRVRYYVRDLDRASEADLSMLRSHLIAKRRLATTTLDRVEIVGIRAQEFLAGALDLLAVDPCGLIAEGRSHSRVNA